MAQGRQLGAGPDAAEHPAGPLGGGPGVGGLPGDLRRRVRQLGDPVGDAVLPQRGEVGPEGVRLHGVRTGLEVRGVDLAQHVRPGHRQDLVAALVSLEVIQTEIVLLQHRAHCPVGDDDTVGQSSTEAQGSGRRVGHIGTLYVVGADR
ncbi:hypothetical protein SDC9_92617 [bioreactor metagenome]|uniref:Uncharacterized protein n=1 Tax=bioreactor metagenome TaxID=1076179 RepID=A0A644ZYA0_9ZZZZ